MKSYQEVFSFESLYKAYKAARKGKRDTKEVIEFEMDLSNNLMQLHNGLMNLTYKVQGYYSFTIYDPKVRIIHALHFKDRIVQHALCDEYLSEVLEPRLIYDNIACRKEKGTHFGIKRVTSFLSQYYFKYGTRGYILKCDIRKYFDHIDHHVLKNKLNRIIQEKRILDLLYDIIDSYHSEEGKGLPLGNQTSQWFALYYLDGFDRLIKEKLRIKYYSRYMDDCVLIHPDKQYLQQCLEKMNEYIEKELYLEFNQKTQLFTIQNGIDYLGFHFYLSNTGKVVRKLRNQTKRKYKRKLKYMQYAYRYHKMNIEEVFQVLNSYDAHLSYGNNDHLQYTCLHHFVLKSRKE